MKQVKNLSVANIKGTNFVRREDLDFEDDGNHFRGFAYKNLPITTLYSNGRVYCSVRPDYINYNNVPWEMWRKEEEYKLCDKYNGTSDLIDLDDLADICERTISKLNELKNKFENIELDTSDVLKNLRTDFVKIHEIIDWFKTVNWFDKKLSSYEFERIARYYNTIKDSLKRIEQTEKEVILGTVDRARLYSWIEDIKENPDYIIGTDYNYYFNELKELAAKEDR